jgi:lipopolysaccharide export system protein LptA
VLTGHVIITQAELKMTAARTVVDYTNNGSMKISLINSTGGVVVTRDNERPWAMWPAMTSTAM